MNLHINYSMLKIDDKLDAQYANLYSDKSEEWRKLGAHEKVKNIRSVAGNLKFKNVVEVGAGDGNILSLLSEVNFSESYTAVEISESAINQIKKKNIVGLNSIVKFDGYILPFKDREFDLAICSHVIEHVEFPRALLREIKRISKQQIFEVPIDFSFNVDKRVEHFTSYGHINIFTPSLFNFLLKTENFEILSMRNALYNKKIFSFNTKKSSKKYILNMIKRAVWKSVPLLMKLKPNTYTVLTQ